jgi:hypothetical protein
MHKSTERVTGMKKFKGDIEGKAFDSTTVFIETRMDDRNGNRRGHCTMDFNAGVSDVFDRLKDVALPSEFEIEWDTVTNGNNVQQIIVDMQPRKIEARLVAGTNQSDASRIASSAARGNSAV